MRSGASDCVGQVARIPGGGLIAQCRVGALGVVVGDPNGDQFAGMGQVATQRLVQELVPHPAVEAFDKAVLHVLSVRDVVSFDLVFGAPLQDRVRRQFRPVVTDDHPGLAAPFEPHRQFPRYAAARDRSVQDRRQIFARDVVHHVHNPNTSSAGELIIHEIQRPARIDPCLDKDRGPCADSLATRLEFADGQPLLAVEPVDAVDLRGLRLALRRTKSRR